MKNSILTSSLILFFAVTSVAQVKLISGGSVSIGSSSSPAARLHVHGSSLFSDTTGSITRAPYIRGTNANSTDSTPDYTWYNNSRCGIFHPTDDNIGICMQGSERFRFDMSGITNYGSAKFYSDPSSTGGALILGGNGYSSSSKPDYTWTHADKTGIFHPDTDNIGFAISGSQRMAILSNGHLLLGGYYDAGQFTIDADSNKAAFVTWTTWGSAYGQAHVSFVNEKTTKNWIVNHNETENFFVYGDGNVWASAYHTFSDSILKENVQTLTDAKTKILALRGVSYNLKPQQLTNPQDTFTVISTDPPRTEIGLIAEEVERVVPEVVATTDHGIKGVAYQNIVALLIEAFKQQNSTIDSLKNQLTICCNSGSTGSQGHRQSNPNGNDNPTPDSPSPRLDQNNPNPFNSKTEIHFYLPEKSSSKILMVFDMQGTLLKQYALNGIGESSITISGNEYKAGMYLYTLVIDGKEIDTKRMILTN